MNAQVKLLEAWKIINIEYYPIQFQPKTNIGQSTRAITKGEVVEQGSSTLGLATFFGDASRAWNRSLSTLKDITTVTMAKKAIKKLVKELSF